MRILPSSLISSLNIAIHVFSYVKDISFIAINIITKNSSDQINKEYAYGKCSSIEDCSNRLTTLANAAYSIMGVSMLLFGFIFYEKSRRENNLLILAKSLSEKIDQTKQQMKKLKEDIAKKIVLARKSELFKTLISKIANGEIQLQEINEDELEYLKKLEKNPFYQKIDVVDKDKKLEELAAQVEELSEKINDLEEEAEEDEENKNKLENKIEKLEEEKKILQNKLEEEKKSLQDKIDQMILSDEDMEEFYEFQKSFFKREADNESAYELQQLESMGTERIRRIKDLKLEVRQLRRQNEIYEGKIKEYRARLGRKASDIQSANLSGAEVFNEY